MPMIASWSGYRPSAIMTSRKLAAMADNATRTRPGSQRRDRRPECGSNRRLSNVPRLLMPSRHGPSLGGTSRPPTVRLPCTRAVWTAPPRTNTCGSPAASAAATAESSSGASASTSTIRPGCSVCADRTKPHTAGTGQIGDVLPRQRHRAPGRHHQRRRGWRSNHDCSTASAVRVAACTSPMTSPDHCGRFE